MDSKKSLTCFSFARSSGKPVSVGARSAISSMFAITCVCRYAQEKFHKVDRELTQLKQELARLRVAHE